MRWVADFIGILAALAGTFWFCCMVLSLQDGRIYLSGNDMRALTTAQTLSFAAISASIAIVAFYASVVLDYANKQLEQTKKTNELLTQLVAQSGNTEAATNADAIPTAEPVVEADISCADGFSADD